MRSRQVRQENADVVVLGSGGAGIRAAIEAHDQGVNVLILSKSGLGQAHTREAEGGFNAALGNVDPDDSWQSHFEDTLREGAGISNPKKVELLAREAIDRVREYDDWGVQFDRTLEGKIDQRAMAAHSHKRTCYASDKIGQELMRVLVEQAKTRKISYIDKLVVLEILTKDAKVSGLLAYDVASGELVHVVAKAIIIATGGYAHLYSNSSHSAEAFGDGVALAYRAGCELADMEMVQFHPTGMITPENARGILVTEAFRGEGAYLLNTKNERFMERYDKERMELSARDIVARAIWREVEEGRGTNSGGVYLDITHVDPALVKQKLSKMFEQFKFLANIDITKEKVEVYPTTHYTMGGIVVDPETAQTCVAGLYACGETTTGVHGANRLGGNSLPDISVFGRRAGLAAAGYATKHGEINSKTNFTTEQQLMQWEQGERGSIKPSELKKKIQHIMSKHANIVRTDDGLKTGLRTVQDLAGLYKNELMVDQHEAKEIMEAQEVGYMLDCAEAVLRSALKRAESRGAHYRSDFPITDQKWLANVICWQNANTGKMDLRVDKRTQEQ